MTPCTATSTRSQAIGGHVDVDVRKLGADPAGSGAAWVKYAKAARGLLKLVVGGPRSCRRRAVHRARVDFLVKLISHQLGNAQRRDRRHRRDRRPEAEREDRAGRTGARSDARSRLVRGER